ncbi:MAG TPA: glutamate formimidoyltransferase [Planctomycetota bacterium]|nr:glutamate formimidoyltransferase [Planctomycetota bacterium]
MGLVECVPNFSEGRRPEVLGSILDEIRAVEGVKLVDHTMDADHNRAVVTFVGEGAPVSEAAFRAVARAKELIDLNQHQGEHPRMGATDVVPFVPLEGTSMEECVGLAHRLGERVGRELGIPVFFYEAAALDPSRRNLADVRKGQFEGLRERIGSDPSRVPDAGPNAIHPTAGATAIGARFFLIAFNVNLETRDVQVAKDIAKKVREKDGGLPGIKAMGFYLDDVELSQVSMNVCNFQATSLLRVYEEIEREARARGVAIRESELVGLAPRAALPPGVAERIRLRGFDPAQQIIEERIA